MTSFKSRVGSYTFQWKQIPRGNSGTAHVEVEPGKSLEVTWTRDEQGIWITLPESVSGFDLQGQRDDNGRCLFQVTQRNSHLHWDGMSCTYGDMESQAVARSSANKGARIRAMMPGKIIRVLIQAGQSVEKDQPMVVMEAMKMENEIRAPQSGRISQIKVAEGQAVESGADLVLIEV